MLMAFSDNRTVKTENAQTGSDGHSFRQSVSWDGYHQIIYTAQDVNLINLQNFRQEEIWFIDTNSLGESTLRPFSDFEVNKDQDPLKAYLSGRFGAVPMIRGEN